MRSAFVLCAAATLLAQEQATFYAAYEDALEAMGKGRWREAALALNRAIHLRPRASAQAQTYGTNFLPNYHPYLNLARCHLELGDLEIARKCLELSRGQGEPEALRAPLERRLQELGSPKVTVPTAIPAASSPAPGAPPLPGRTVPAQAGEPESTPEPPRVPGQAAPTPPPPGPEPSNKPQEPPLPAPSFSLPPREAEPKPPGESQPSPVRGHFTWSPGLGLGGLTLLGLILLWHRRRTKPEPEDQVLPAPERVGPYRILQRLGRGGFASTYLAEAPSGQRVALKVPHPHLLEDPEAMRRFHQEALLGAKLDHPNLMRIVDPGPEGPRSWIAFEFVDAPSLAQVLEGEGALPLRRSLEIALAVAEAMAHAHAQGVVHRDLKPGNILVGNPVRVLDFGIARIMDAHTLTSTYAFLGSPTHAAPEAQLKTGVGPAADRYSLGILLFEMLTGQPPFAGETPFEVLEHHRRSPLPELSLLCPGVPEELQRLIKRLTLKEPDERPEDGELLRRLRELLASLPQP